MESLSDEDLIREIRRLELAEELTGEKGKSEAAFAQLVERHNKPFARLVLLRFNLDSATADEVTQDFWLECYNALPRYSPERPFLAWATTILFRTTERFISKRRKEISLSPQSDFFDVQVASGENPEEAALKRSENEALLTALQRLPEDLALLIQLRFFENKKIEEMSEMTGLARSTIFEKLNLAYKKLRRTLGDTPK